MKFLGTNANKRPGADACGMTLIEVLIAAGIGSIVLMIMMTVFLSSNRAFADMGNYVSMNRASRLALEQMTRDIRRSRNLVSFATNRIEFNYDGTNSLSYAYDPSTRQLLRSKTGEADQCLLSGCDRLEFSLYKGVPLTGGNFGKTTDPLLGKSISVSWRCSRDVLGQRRDSEYSEEALIVIRNQPVL